MFGTVRERDDGRVELRFERRFAHSRDKVWRALTSTAELRTWFVEILDVREHPRVLQHEGLEKLGRALDL
jgi:uncharacterized protein YndB with AHSA1/START domain